MPVCWTLYDEYYARQPDGTYGNRSKRSRRSSAWTTASGLTVEEDDAAARLHGRRTPLRAWHDRFDYFCTFFPPATDPRIAITGAGAGPIVVMGTTGDPATPLASTAGWPTRSRTAAW